MSVQVGRLAQVVTGRRRLVQVVASRQVGAGVAQVGTSRRMSSQVGSSSQVGAGSRKSVQVGVGCCKSAVRHRSAQVGSSSQVIYARVIHRSAQVGADAKPEFRH